MILHLVVDAYEAPYLNTTVGYYGDLEGIWLEALVQRLAGQYLRRCDSASMECRWNQRESFVSYLIATHSDFYVPDVQEISL